MTDSEREWVERAAAGDRDAVAELMRRHLPALRGWVRLKYGSTLRATESISDVVQSTFRDILENLHRFQFTSENAFKAWLYTTASRKIADRAEYWGAARRDPKRVRPYDEAPAESGVADVGAVLDVYRSFCSPSREVAGREEAERIERAFSALGEEKKEIILLARVAGLSHSEIGERLGIPAGTARMRLFRALGELAESLDRRPG